jgi:Ni,Fe-hydrogenase III small subunit
MFVLLRELQRQRRAIGLERPAVRGSLAVRHVDAGSCNGCEHELNQLGTPFYDLARFGIGIVASPRHADVLLVTGVVTTRMLEPLRMAYASMPEPRLVAALGDCAAGCNVLGAPDALAGGVAEILPVALTIPGCPPGPALIAERLLEALALARAPGPGPPGPGR